MRYHEENRPKYGFDRNIGLTKWEGNCLVLNVGSWKQPKPSVPVTVPRELAPYIPQEEWTNFANSFNPDLLAAQPDKSVTNHKDCALACCVCCPVLPTSWCLLVYAFHNLQMAEKKFHNSVKDALEKVHGQVHNVPVFCELRERANGYDPLPFYGINLKFKPPAQQPIAGQPMMVQSMMIAPAPGRAQPVQMEMPLL